MFGRDEFGNTRLLAITFALVFAALSAGAIFTSQTLMETSGASAVSAVQLRY